MLKKASQMYREFISKAGADKAYAEAVKRSKDRIEDIDATVQFIEDGEAARKAEAESAASQAKDAAPPPAEEAK
jgi:hypothetical protein